MTKINYFRNLFLRLKIPEYKKLVDELVLGDYDFYNGYARRFSKLNDSTINQIGRGDLQEFFYNFGGLTFKISEDTTDEDRVSYAIYDEKMTESLCMLIFVKADERIAYIETLSNFPNCAIQGMPKTRGGSLILGLTLDFIKKVLKNKYNLKYVWLKDNSFFYCQEAKEKIDMDSLYMFTRGNTWYGRYEFLPFNINTGTLDFDSLIDYSLNKKLIRTIRLKCTDIEKYLLDILYNKPSYEQYISKSTIKKLCKDHNEKPIIEFFAIFMKEYDQTCIFFSLIYKQVMNDIGMINLHGRPYYLPLNDESRHINF
ncbi:MAG: hypothetical protein Hyperionvirus19_39 [Hyperionvirus sp.]|uniref:Uncharacterized protein n=1 Tax=Hyperionvirus sp. TaxID=2487770 RepID=A0A3G5AAF9_9VIRU|nr:MAG: hypothetical protein Hyperionvirus19_39 [Hyperionvirus sp.]